MDEVVKHTNVDASFVYPSGKDVFSLTEKLIWHMDEPYQSQATFLGYHVFQKAKEKFPDVFFAEMGAEKLDFPDHSFDVVTISMALHHLPHVQTSLKEMQRVVKSGGFIIVSELFSDHLNPAQEVHKLFHHFRSSTDRLLGVSHNETFNRNEIVEMIQDSGIQPLFHFDWLKENNLILEEKDLEMRINQLEECLKRERDFPK